MCKPLRRIFVPLLLLLFHGLTAQAQEVVYNNLAAPVSAYPESVDASPAFGDSLHLTKSGTLTSLGITLFNNAGGPILTGNTLVQFFDNTTPYTGGTITNPFLGAAQLDYDFTAQGGLAIGVPDISYFDCSALNIHLPVNVLVVQQFTQTTGTSTSLGVLLMPDPTVGTSPQTVYVSSGITAPGLHTFSGIPNQFGYFIEVQPDPAPEPSTIALVAGGILALQLRARRARA